jgi:hypothetical protein
VTTRSSVQIPIERQKSSQAAGVFALDDLPDVLTAPAAVVRLAPTARGDEALAGVTSTAEITTLRPGQVLANYGRSEARWASDHDRRRAGRAPFVELLSYARQLVGLDADGTVRICLMGHAGQGQSVPLWVPESDVTLTVQPGDVLLRFDDQSFEL